MRKILITSLFMTVASSYALADFRADVSSHDVRAKLSKPFIIDLAVGEIGIVAYPNFCVIDDKVFLAGNAGLSPERNPYSANYIVKREPGNTVSVNLEMGKESTKRTLNDALKDFVLAASFKGCEEYPVPKSVLLQVTSVNGYSTFSEILSLKN